MQQSGTTRKYLFLLFLIHNQITPLINYPFKGKTDIWNFHGHNMSII